MFLFVCVCVFVLFLGLDGNSGGWILRDCKELASWPDASKVQIQDNLLSLLWLEDRSVAEASANTTKFNQSQPSGHLLLTTYTL